MRVFNLAEELEKEREKNKKLEKQLNCKKEYTKYLPEDTEFIILTKPDYDRQQEELQDKVFELEEQLKLAKEQDLYGIKVFTNNETYNEYKRILQDQINELQDRIDKAHEEIILRKNEISGLLFKELLDILEGDNK